MNKKFLLRKIVPLVIIVMIFILTGYYTYTIFFDKEGGKIDQLYLYSDNIPTTLVQGGISFQQGYKELRTLDDMYSINFLLQDRELPPSNSGISIVPKLEADLEKDSEATYIEAGSPFDYVYCFTQENIQFTVLCRPYVDSMASLFESSSFMDTSKFDYWYRGTIYGLAFSTFEIKYYGEVDDFDITIVESIISEFPDLID